MPPTLRSLRFLALLPLGFAMLALAGCNDKVIGTWEAEDSGRSMEVKPRGVVEFPAGETFETCEKAGFKDAAEECARGGWSHGNADNKYEFTLPALTVTETKGVVDGCVCSGGTVVYGQLDGDTLTIFEPENDTKLATLKRK